VLSLRDTLEFMSFPYTSLFRSAFFGRVNYNFQGKYMLSASMRQEGSTRFGENNKWGLFPAVSAGWTISSESFMSNVTFVNDLKLDRKSTRLNSSHVKISYAVFC